MKLRLYKADHTDHPRWSISFLTRQKRDLAAHLFQRAVDLLEEAYRGQNGNVELAYQNKKWVERAAIVMRELEKLQEDDDDDDER